MMPFRYTLWDRICCQSDGNTLGTFGSVANQTYGDFGEGGGYSGEGMTFGELPTVGTSLVNGGGDFSGALPSTLPTVGAPAFIPGGNVITGGNSVTEVDPVTGMQVLYNDRFPGVVNYLGPDNQQWSAKFDPSTGKLVSVPFASHPGVTDGTPLSQELSNASVSFDDAGHEIAYTPATNVPVPQAQVDQGVEVQPLSALARFQLHTSGSISGVTPGLISEEQKQALALGWNGNSAVRLPGGDAMTGGVSGASPSEVFDAGGSPSTADAGGPPPLVGEAADRQHTTFGTRAGNAVAQGLKSVLSMLPGPVGALTNDNPSVIGNLAAIGGFAGLPGMQALGLANTLAGIAGIDTNPGSVSTPDASSGAVLNAPGSVVGSSAGPGAGGGGGVPGNPDATSKAPEPVNVAGLTDNAGDSVNRDLLPGGLKDSGSVTPNIAVGAGAPDVSSGSSPASSQSFAELVRKYRMLGMLS